MCDYNVLNVGVKKTKETQPFVYISFIFYTANVHIYYMSVAGFVKKKLYLNRPGVSITGCTWKTFCKMKH